MTEYQYIADNAWKAARERLALLGMGADPWTIRKRPNLLVDDGVRHLERQPRLAHPAFAQQSDQARGGTG